jgi:hypothetical protein
VTALLPSQQEDSDALSNFYASESQKLVGTANETVVVHTTDDVSKTCEAHAWKAAPEASLL